MIHTTISGNSSPDGAIYEELYSGLSGLPYTNLYDHCTITGNQTTSTDRASGINLVSMVISMRNTIVANNTGGTGQIQVATTNDIQSLGHNLISDSMPSFTATGDLQNTDPKLLPLAANGGSTLTHALRCSSPAVNGGVVGSTSVDQRGVAYVGIPDIGAYEYQPLPLSAGTILVSGNASCANPVRLTAPVWGQSFVFTGPNGFVFSNVYRTAGAYTAYAEGVKLGGTYTLSVSDEEGCRTVKSMIIVQGPSTCP